MDLKKTVIEKSLKIKMFRELYITRNIGDTRTISLRTSWVMKNNYKLSH